MAPGYTKQIAAELGSTDHRLHFQGLPVLPPANRRIVLIGAGHTNLHVVREWMRNPISGVRLTLVSAGRHAAYSGMLPGCLAGLYSADRMLIDLDRLCHAAGVELIADAAVGLDPEGRQVLFAERPPLHYDVCSIGIGSQPGTPDDVRRHPGFVSIKPMPSTLERIDRVLGDADTAAPPSSGTRQSSEGDEMATEVWRLPLQNHASQNGPKCPRRVVVVGAGAAGVEIAFGIQSRLRRRNEAANIELLDAGDRVLPSFRDRTSRLAAKLLHESDITFTGNSRVASSDGTSLVLGDGRRIEADIVLWVTRAVPPPMLDNVPLPKSDSGFLRVRSTLQSETDDRVFVVGDCAEFIDAAIDRAGVYAVRQGPILFENLRRKLLNQPLQSYRPQRDFLRLLSTGDGKAIMQWRGFAAHGPRWWKLKDRIDSRFMRMHEPDATRMTGHLRAADLMPSPAMRCRGCGGKTSSSLLHDVLQRLRTAFPAATDSPQLQSDDTALIATPTESQAVSVDFFPAFIDDPWLTGRIAAIHAMSDLWASGVQPSTALAMITLPEDHPRLKKERLFHVLHGAMTEFQKAGVTLTGGHTTDGDELSVGFTILGPTSGTLPFRKGGLKPGQHLILTKPLGTGVILAALDYGLPVAAAMTSALDNMLRSNAAAAAIAARFGVTAATDITGFGLAGHLGEMLDQSNLTARINVAAIPTLPGARELLEQGIRSSIHAANVAGMSERLLPVESSGNSISREHPSAQVLFDPQTSGGLLLAVDAERLADLSVALSAASFAAVVIAET